MFRRMVVLCVALAAAGASGVVGHAQLEAQPPQPLGFVDGRLVPVDAESLRALPGKGIPVGLGGCAPRQGGTACWTIPPWTVSPDGMQLAVARNDASSLRLVDARRLRVTAEMRIHGGAVGALAWLAAGRVLAVQETRSERQRVVAIDLSRRRVVASHALRGSVLDLARTPQQLVALVAPAEAIGPARLAVVDRRGAVRFAPLGRILAGSKLLAGGSDHRVDARVPGLTVDPQGRRAFVVAQSVVAEIDLQTLAVSYHTLARTTSLQAKQVSGYRREAHWLGAGLLAVSGSDTAQGETQPAGLMLLATRDWSARTVDARVTGFQVAGELLLATRESGLAAYGLDGRLQYELFEGERTWLAHVYGGRAYVGAAGRDSLRIVELATGRVVGERAAPLPWLVQGEAAGWWE